MRVNGERGSESGTGSSGELPWASVFDAAANVRALSAIQAEGFKAASTLVDRFIRAATSGLGGDRPTTVAPLSNQQRADLFGATDLEPLIRSWWAMAGQLLYGAAPHISNPAPPPRQDRAALDVATGDMTGQVTLQAAAHGPATAEVWLHNSGADDIGHVGLRCSDLLAAGGAVVPAAAVMMSPAQAALPARSSRGVAVSVELTADTAPGRYRGTLLVDGYPDLWLPVVLTVGMTSTSS
jgi:hypothetical protein